MNKLLPIFLLLLAIPVAAQTPISTSGSIIVNVCKDGGTTDAYACSLPIAPTDYTDGQIFWFKANTANTS